MMWDGHASGGQNPDFSPQPKFWLLIVPVGYQDGFIQISEIPHWCGIYIQWKQSKPNPE